MFAPRAVDAEIFGGRVLGEDAHLAMTFVEPLELVTAARSLDGELRAFAASRDALALLRDPVEPIASAWRWVCAELDIAPERHAAFVVARGTELRALPAGDFLPDPILALTRQQLRYGGRPSEPTHELIDAESAYGAQREVAFERAADGWLLRALKRDFLVNGTTRESPYRLATGDHIRTPYWSYQVIAII